MPGTTDGGNTQTTIDAWRLFALERRTRELEESESKLLVRMEKLERTLASTRSRASAPTSPVPGPPRPGADVSARPSWVARAAAAPSAPGASELRSAAPTSPPAADEPRRAVAAAATSGTTSAAPGVQPPARTAWELTDLLAGRVLAWIGGAAVFIGVLLFLALAVAHGWIGPAARTLLAAVGGLGLLGVGCWLHERRGRTDAARIAVGCAIASLFATVVVATQVYHLVDAPAGLALSLGIGTLASTLAVRWAAVPIAALGIVGALLAPVLVGAGLSGSSVAFVLVAAAAAVAVLVWQRWRWLCLAVAVCSLPQWMLWLLAGQSQTAALLTLTAFGALGFVGAIGYEVRVRAPSLDAAALVLIAANAFVLAVVGWWSLGGGSARLWIAALAFVHLLAGGYGGWANRLSTELRHYLLALGVILADVAFGATANGLVLGLGWAAVTMACAARLRLPSKAVARFDAPVLGFALGAHISLVLLRALEMAPPQALGGGFAPAAMLAVGLLATVSFAAARVLPPSAGGYRVALNALGLLTVAYLTAIALSGTALVAAWAIEAVALAELERRTDDLVAVVAAIAFLAGAVVLSLAAPGVAGTGQRSYGLDAATTAGALVTFASVRMGIALGRHRALRWALFVLAMLGLAYVSARMLDGVALVAAWAVEAVVIGELSRRRDDGALRAGALGFLAAAATLATALFAPPGGLIYGVPQLGAAAAALIATAVASARLAFVLELPTPRRLGSSEIDESWLRRILWGAAAGSLLYLASVAIVSAFQPAAGVAAANVLDLGVRQEGQLLLSVLWSAVGLVALVLGLRVGSPTVRGAALVLLLFTSGKVFLYDMSTLDSLYRVVSFVVFGLLLLAGAHTWQRLRPRPLPDLREVEAGQP